MRQIILFFLLIAATSVVSRGQVNPKPTPPPKPDEQQEPVRVFTEEIRLPVAAKDSYGHYDPTLEPDDLMVLEDGEQQQIKSVQHLPTNVLLLIDTGNQLGLKDTKLTRDVALRVIATLYPGTRIAIMQFAMKPELLQNWSTDRAASTKIVKTKLNWGKSSRLADAFAAAANQFNGTTPGTRHIIIITDGVEAPGGRVSMTSAVKQLNSVQASVHIISYTLMARLTLKGQTKKVSSGDGVQRDGNPGSNPVANGDPTLPVGVTRTPSFKIGSVDLDAAMRRKRKEYERATQDSEKNLTAVAEESGGQIILPISGSDLLAQVEEISRDIGSQYVVTYRPTHPLAEAKPGEYRRVEVASRRVGLYLRSRRGYVVPGGK